MTVNVRPLARQYEVLKNTRCYNRSLRKGKLPGSDEIWFHHL